MATNVNLDPKLIEFCASDSERLYVETVLSVGSYRQASRDLGKNVGTIRDACKRVAERAARQGYSPAHDMFHTAPATHLVKGTSTLYGEDGQVKQQWVKTNLKAEDLASQIEEVATALAERVEGKAKPVKPPKHSDDDLLVVYPIGDPHIGMLAWGAETGEDFDLSIARRDLSSAMREITRAAPPAKTAIIANLGDLFHADDETNRTPRGKNVLDVDGRYSKVIGVGVEILVGLVEQALTRHEKVILRNESGNHDKHTSLWLPIVLSAYYRDEPRVEVVMDPTPFWYYEFGLVLLGTTHGDGTKPSNLPGIMATDQFEAWGRTRFRYWLHGHIHSTTRHEFPGAVVESFRTLAAKDAWHTKEGYRSGRDISAVAYHLKYGEVARHRVDITRVRENVA